MAQTHITPGAAIDPQLDAADFRHLIAFREAHKERSYTKAADRLSTTRRSLLRMIDHLEATFHCRLFEEGRDGLLTPSPFAERLYNDLRFLSASLERFRDHVEAVHKNGRVLHIGSSPGMFRTRTFRHLFRELQSITGLRASYASFHPEDAAKVLTSGHCDLYFGCWNAPAKRFVTHDVGSVPFRTFVRHKPGRAERPARNPSAGAGPSFIVSLDGKLPKPGEPGWQPLPETRWLHWLDHPEECPEGTVVCAPDMPVDPELWAEGDEVEAARQPLHANFLRQHPYEFLPALADRIITRLTLPS